MFNNRETPLTIAPLWCDNSPSKRDSIFMIPPDDDSKQAAPACDVDLKTRAIRFLGCADREAMISAAEKRAAAVSGMIGAHTGFTNRQRQRMNRERNFLHWWRSTDWQDYKPVPQGLQLYRDRCGHCRTTVITLQPNGHWNHQVVL